MILLDRCSFLYDLASLFPGRGSTFETRQQKSANRTVTVMRKISVTCQICRGSRRKASFFSFQPPNLEKVSQKSFVFQLLISAFEGSLAELLGV